LAEGGLTGGLHTGCGTPALRQIKRRSEQGHMKRVVAGLFLAAVLVILSMLQAPAGGAAGTISSPRDRAVVRGLVPIEGTATDPSFQKYEIHYGPEPNAGDQWTPIQGSPFTAPVVQGRLGLWDTTIIPDGLYSLRLRVVRLDGNYEEFFVRGIQVANALPPETPTPKPSPTPAGPTQTPAPTPTVVIAVPTVASPTPKATDTPRPTQTPEPTRVPVKLPFGITSMSDAACRGTIVTAAVFVGIGVLFAFKGAIGSLIGRLTGRDRRDTEE
jgi:hypothetical protein